MTARKETFVTWSSISTDSHYKSNSFYHSLSKFSTDKPKFVANKFILMKNLIFFLTAISFFSCKNNSQGLDFQEVNSTSSGIVVLGIAQDAGFPQADCRKECCAEAWKNPHLRRSATCLALFDSIENKYWLFEATPDIKLQMNQLQKMHSETSPELAGIFLTHAHIGHYTGLMHLGHEVMGTKEIPVFAMPRMRSFLTENGPWSQLVDLNNITLQNLSKDSTIHLNSRFSVTPIRVPHRDEFSETVGFRIESPTGSVLFIPDIDKWQKWDRNIIKEIAKVDLAFLDATFFQNGEIPGRDMALIPHPFVEETMKLFENQPLSEKAKIRFIHFNHTNPALQKGSDAQKEIFENGFGIAEEGDSFQL